MKEIPYRYRVTFETSGYTEALSGNPFGGVQCVHQVVTFQGSEKAVAMAALNHHFVHEELGIFKVVVESLGRLEVGADGYVLDDDELLDREEW